jgi:hypothetical protein
MHPHNTMNFILLSNIPNVVFVHVIFIVLLGQLNQLLFRKYCKYVTAVDLQINGTLQTVLLVHESQSKWQVHTDPCELIEFTAQP